MRNDLHGWFAIGAVLSVLAAFLPSMLGYSAGGRVPVDVSILLSAVTLIGLVTLGRLLFGILTIRIERRSRPHTLFKPSYDQR